MQSVLGSSCEFVGSSELQFLYQTGFTGLIGSIAFSVSRRNREMPIPLSAGKKAKEVDCIIAVRSCRFFIVLCSQKNSLEEGFKLLPFFRKGKKS